MSPKHWVSARREDACVPHLAGFLGQTPTLGLARFARGTGATWLGLLVFHTTSPDVRTALRGPVGCVVHRMCVYAPKAM